MNATQVQNDTLTVIICSQFHKALSVKSRAIKIAKCCKVMRDRSVGDAFTNNVFKTVITNTQRGNYGDVVKWCNKIETKYMEVYL